MTAPKQPAGPAWWVKCEQEQDGHIGDVAVFLFCICAIAYILVKGI